ncbi:TrkH family potassium uptake protein [Agrobacterium pusense]|uniref:TrkH family potassium uptake protein n=1 Tax=Agrobacterium pusense TaxID=648995 RepID=UPI003FD52199
MTAANLRSAIYIASLFGIYLSVAMMVPALADFYVSNPDAMVFIRVSVLCTALFAGTAMATREGTPQLNRRMGVLLVNLLWIVFCVLGALPLWLSGEGLTFFKALFESVSAVTTTGSTVMTRLDHAPPGVLLWRSMLQWFGGIGIVALGLFVMPFLRLGGMSFFRLESSDKGDKVFARIASFLRAFVAIYVTITLVCASAYHVLGMDQFDALNHAMTTVATGGFSTHDASFAYFDSVPLLWAGTFFMSLCSLPFSILILFAVKRSSAPLRDPQIITFLGYLILSALALGVYHHLHNNVAIGTSLAHSFFNLASILSTSGFASQDYTAWGPLAVSLAFVATFVGGCSGSTAGGIKAYRFVIMYRSLRPAIMKVIYPDSVTTIRYGGTVVDADMQKAIFLFFSVFVSFWAMGTVVLSALGYDFQTAASSVLTALSNVGPGIGSMVGPAGNFAEMSNPALLLLSMLMLMGRLEIVTVLIILSPLFWRN